MLISFVIPCYKSEKTISTVTSTIMETVRKEHGFEYEIILVNDCSPDNTWDKIKELVNKYKNITGINLAKNSGQQCAIMAGLRQARGDLIASCDDDGQTPIETVFEFYRYMVEGDYDIVCANYRERGKRSFIRRAGSKANEAMMDFFLDKPKSITTSVYFLAKKFVIDEMVNYENAYPHIGGLILRTTRKIGNVQVEQKERAAGTSGYSLKKLFSTWVNGLTTFSIKPLRIAVWFGFVMAAIGFIAILILVGIKLTNNNIALGWTSMIATSILIGGINMIVLGVIGEYIGRIYLSLNHNPQYVIREIIENNSK